jgi:hypothetical protein
MFPRQGRASRAAQLDTLQLDHVMPIEAARKDLAAIGGSARTGVHDLRRDVGKLPRDARRGLLKMQARCSAISRGCRRISPARRRQPSRPLRGGHARRRRAATRAGDVPRAR